MIVMPSNCTGWMWTALARESGRLGHLYSSGGERGPWPWFPYALDNGCFGLWHPSIDFFDESLWLGVGLPAWRDLLKWAGAQAQKPRWAIVADRPGNWAETVAKWSVYAPEVEALGIPLAVAVQDGATVAAVRALRPLPSVVAVGGSTDFKWGTAEEWLAEFEHVHVLRVNSPERLYWLDDRGCESCDGTGWNRGDVKQFRGLEEWAMKNPDPCRVPLYPWAAQAKRLRKAA